MKTVTVFVPIQIDINSKGDNLEQVIEALGIINEQLNLGICGDLNPQILTDTISSSEIVEEDFY